MTTLPTIRALVCDAFGTTVHIANSTRPFTRLRDQLVAQGYTAPDFFVQGMSHRHTPLSQAQHYGATLSEIEVLAFNEEVKAEMESVVAYPDTYHAIEKALSSGLVVVIGSNLGFPYGEPIHSIMSRHGSVTPLGGSANLQLALSYDMGCIKPDPSFYQQIAASLQKQYGIRPGEIAMIGDKQREDVDAPRQSGWSATQLRRDRGETLLSAMNRLGLIL